LPGGNVGLGVEPIGQATKFFSFDLSRSNAINEMIKQGRRRILGRRSPAVKAANDALANHGSFDRVFRLDETFGQGGKLWAAELPFGIQLVDKADDARLLFRVKSLYLIDYLRCCHDGMLPAGSGACKRAPLLTFNS